MLLVANLAARVVSLMPPNQVIDTQQKVYHALKMCPNEIDAKLTTYWAMHNTFNDVVFELAHNGFLPIVFTWILSLLLFTKIMMDKF